MCKECSDDFEDEIYDFDEHEGVKISCYRVEDGGCLDEFNDQDGDRILAHAVMSDIPHDDASVVAFVSRGCDPSHAACVLRKIADMYDGPHGLALAKLQRSEPINFAVRLADGNVDFFNSIKFASWMLNSDKGRANG